MASKVKENDLTPPENLKMSITGYPFNFNYQNSTQAKLKSQSRILCKRKIVQIKKNMMRPIVSAVGLICILAHDYLIVKIKMLFRYSVTIVEG